METYGLDDFELYKHGSIQNNIMVGINKENNESFYIKAMRPNQLINLIIANPLFRKCLGEDLIPEVGILVDYTSSTVPKYYSVLKEIKLLPAYNLPHMYHGMRCSGSGWGVGCEVVEANIGVNNSNCTNAEKGGIATILFQDSDHHLDNEAYVKQGDKFSYIRLDVDHSDMVFTPLLQDVIELKETLKRYNFSCDALNLLAEFIDQREIFKQSILQSLGNISRIFSDEYIHRIYQGLEGFKASYDQSKYYHLIEISGNEDLSKLVLSNFDLIFDYVQDQLAGINADHSFELGGVVCNP